MSAEKVHLVGQHPPALQKDVFRMIGREGNRQQLHPSLFRRFAALGVIAGLAIGIVIALPEMKMPAVTQFVDGTGPVFSGSIFPFLFITIACGAISGFHALVSSGTTPKLVDNEAIFV